MMGRAGRPLDDGVAGAGRAVVAAGLISMMPSGAEVLGLVAGAATQVVKTTAGATHDVRPADGTAAPFLQLGTVVLRAAGHASAGDRVLLGHTCQQAKHTNMVGEESITRRTSQ